MAVERFEFTIDAHSHCSVTDVTPQVADGISRSRLRDGIACVSVVGSTAAVSTIEYEPGLLKDLPELFERLIPSDRLYEHDHTWHDGNGFSHLRSFLVKTSHTVPFAESKLLLGTWQQIVVANFDNRARSRRIVVQLVGE